MDTFLTTLSRTLSYLLVLLVLLVLLPPYHTLSRVTQPYLQEAADHVA